MKPTRDQFVSAHNLKLFGLVCDACIRQLRGEPLAAFQIDAFKLINRELAEIYAELTAETNGRPTANAVPPVKAVGRG